MSHNLSPRPLWDPAEDFELKQYEYNSLHCRAMTANRRRCRRPLSIEDQSKVKSLINTISRYPPAASEAQVYLVDLSKAAMCKSGRPHHNRDEAVLAELNGIARGIARRLRDESTSRQEVARNWNPRELLTPPESPENEQGRTRVARVGLRSQGDTHDEQVGPLRRTHVPPNSGTSLSPPPSPSPLRAVRSSAPSPSSWTTVSSRTVSRERRIPSFSENGSLRTMSPSRSPMSRTASSAPVIARMADQSTQTMPTQPRALQAEAESATSSPPTTASQRTPTSPLETHSSSTTSPISHPNPPAAITSSTTTTSASLYPRLPTTTSPPSTTQARPTRPRLRRSTSTPNLTQRQAESSVHEGGRDGLATKGTGVLTQEEMYAAAIRRLVREEMESTRRGENQREKDAKVRAEPRIYVKVWRLEIGGFGVRWSRG